MTAVEWEKREAFAIGTRIGELQAMVYSRDQGVTWEAAIDRRGHLEEHRDGFDNPAPAMHHALEYINENGRTGESQPTAPGLEPPPSTAAARERSLRGASTS